MTERTGVPTLDDVARAARVSTATVSRCLNTPERVSEKTRDTVMQAVETLGYTPHFGARVLASKRSYTIGAIIPTMANAIFATGLQAFQEELHAQGYTLLVSSTGYNPAAEAEQIRALVGRGADGLMLIGYDRKPEVYAYLARQTVPTLLTWAFRAESPLPCVGFDNRAAMRSLAEVVLDKGHSRIAMISGVIEGNDRAAERVEGVQDALRARGLNPGIPVVSASYDIESGARAFAELMARTPRPTAVMCGNDVLAAGAVQQAEDMGLRVPGDVSVTGFDDIELARIVRPHLTTVHVPHRKMGQQAARELIALIEGRSTGTPIEVQTTLELRGSLAAPAS